MPDEDTPDEGGLEPADEATEAVDPAAPTEQAAPAPEPVTFTADQLAEHLPQFGDRFLAHHDPAEALKLYGERDRNVQAALTRYTQGAPTDADLDTLREGGYDLPEAVEEPEEPAQPLWGAPWAEPTDYDSFVALANTRPDKAMEFIDRQPEGVIDADTRTQVLNYWAEHDRAGAISYEREQARVQAIGEAKAYADRMREEMRAEFAPVQAGHTAATVAARQAKLDNLITFAQQNVPEFAEHQEGVQAIVLRNLEGYKAQGRNPVDYFDEILALPRDKQIAYLSELTGAAAWSARPAVEAQAQAETAAADAQKIAAGGERGRGAAASGNGAQTQAKRDFTAAFERLRDVEIPIH